MFFDMSDNPACKPLPHNPFKACVAPRPIGWISTLGADGVVNAAPYSFFNAVASEPPMVMYTSSGLHAGGRPKDTVTNIEATGEFVVNLSTWDLRDKMNQTSLAADADLDELAMTGLTTAPSRIVKAPRIAESPINMECVLYKVFDLPCTNPDGRNMMIIGEVVALHIDESVLTDGMIDIAKLRPLARLGYRDFACVEETFSMALPQPAPA